MAHVISNWREIVLFEELIASVLVIGVLALIWRKSLESTWTLKAVTILIFGLILALVLDLVRNESMSKVIEFGLLRYLLIGLFLVFIARRNSTISIVPEKACPEISASKFSRLFFLWFRDLALLGYKRTLTEDDIWDARPQDLSNALSSTYKANLGKSLPSVNVLIVLLKAFRRSIVMTGILKIMEQVLVFLGPYAVKLIIGLEEEENPLPIGYLYIAFLVAVSTTKILVGNQYLYKTSVIAMRVRSMLSNAIYEKIHHTSYSVSNMGVIVNMIGVDSQALEFFFSYFHVLWAVPVQIVFSLYFQWKQLGVTVFAGFLALILLLLLDLKIAGRSRNLIQEEMKCKDGRIKATSELLTGIKGIKMTASEPLMKAEIMSHRQNELGVLRMFSYTASIADFIWTIAPFLASLITFGAHLTFFEGSDLTAQTALTHLILINIMQGPLKSIPSIVQGIVQASVGLKRVNTFMAAEEICNDSIEYDTTEEDDAVVMHNASFGWSKNEANVLESIDLTVKKGSLIGVTGETGSGKSSFLACLTGHLTKNSGYVKLNSSRCCVVPQQPWIQNKTFEENIVLRSKCNSVRYQEVIRACALWQDLPALPKGRIAEKGSSLSGGQKQRISLARAVYSNGDIYLIDDLLSSIDSRVGNYIFENVIGASGILRDKTRFLVTNDPKYLEKVDQIILIKNNTVRLIQTPSKCDSTTLDVGISPSAQTNELSIPNQSPAHQNLAPTKLADTSTVHQRRQNTSEDESFNKEGQPSQNLNVVPEIRTGNVENPTKVKVWELLQLFCSYVSNVGYTTVMAILCLSICSQVLSAGASIVVSHLTGGIEEKRNLALYAGLGFGQGIIALFATIVLKRGTISAASRFHESFLLQILNAPLWYFETTPSGKLLERFSKEVDTLDKSLGVVLGAWLKSLLSVGTTFVLILYAKPLYLVAVIPLVILCLLVQRFNSGIFNELRNLESVTKAQLLSHVSETLDGTQTLRAFKLQESLIQDFQKKMDAHISSYYAAVVAHRFMAVCLECIAAVLILLISLFAVSEEAKANSGLVGVFMTSALEIAGTLNVLVIVSCSLETHLIALGRNFVNSGVPQESDAKDSEHVKLSLPNNVSSLANIIFENYSAKYRAQLDSVLHNITGKISAGEKICIIGRTGAGKSSVLLAILRLIQAETGRILIGGQDIAKIKVKDLRNALTIVPQDPFLMPGTIRSNLDPLNLHKTSTIWEALNRTHLKLLVEGLEGQLEHHLSLSGSSLSLGQRQLLCITRALLKETKIMLLDEASSGLDEKVDDHIQDVILKKLTETTVLVITHKLKSIMEYSRVMVIDRGYLVEFDTPANLMKDRSSKCFELVNEFGVKF